MITLKRCLIILTGVFTIVAGAGLAQSVVPAATNAQDRNAAAYALRLPLTAQGSAPVQRFDVPTQALIASQSAQMNDLRVLDANGRVVPMARLPVLPMPSVDAPLTALPILGSSNALSASGIALKVDDQGRVRIISVDGKTVDGDKTASVVGTLFNTRGETGAAQRLVVNAIIPAGQPVTFVVEGSEDLKTWRPFGEGSIYRPPNEADKASDSAIALDGQLSGKTQLRLTWRTETPLLTPITISKAVLTTQRDTTLTTKVVAASVPPLLDNYILEFAMPFATPIVTIAVDAKGREGLLPVTILGRNNNQEPWAPLGQGNAQAAAAPISLSSRSITMIRIEADPRTGGFVAPPAIRFGIASRDIAFVTSGTPPFTFATTNSKVLAAGPEAQSDAFLPLESITQVAPDALPRAIIPDPAITPLILASAGTSGTPKRDFLLWGTLLGLTVLLGAMAWHLWKRPGLEPPTLGPTVGPTADLYKGTIDRL